MVASTTDKIPALVELSGWQRKQKSYSLGKWEDLRVQAERGTLTEP
jgi:hypothetical protein